MRLPFLHRRPRPTEVAWQYGDDGAVSDPLGEELARLARRRDGIHHIEVGAALATCRVPGCGAVLGQSCPHLSRFRTAVAS